MSAGDEGPTLRTFVALEIEASLRARLSDAVAGLRELLPAIRLVSAENVHLTLRFLGPSSETQLAKLCVALETAARSCPACDASVATLGLFPERGAPRVLWLGIDVPPSLLALQGECERAARAAGFARESRPFQPHVTLGRWRERSERPRLPPLDLGATRLRTLTLFRSELHPTGACHTPIARFPLAGIP